MCVKFSQTSSIFQSHPWTSTEKRPDLPSLRTNHISWPPADLLGNSGRNPVTAPAFEQTQIPPATRRSSSGWIWETSGWESLEPPRSRARLPWRGEARASTSIFEVSITTGGGGNTNKIRTKLKSSRDEAENYQSDTDSAH